MRIEVAKPADAGALTALAHASKAHWGYPASWIEAWREQLTITPAYLHTHAVFVLRGEDAGILGFYALRGDEDVAWLEHLWVAPAAMGHGAGRTLFAHAEHTARSTGFSRMRIESDPHAEGFYGRMGATTIWHRRADMGGEERRLPIMEKRIAQEPLTVPGQTAG